MRAMKDRDLFHEQVDALGISDYVQDNVMLKNSSGPSTNRLNQFYRGTGGIAFYDRPFLHTDKFVLKYTCPEWSTILCRHESQDDCVMKYNDEEVELVHQILYRFQAGCDLLGLTTRSSVAFFRSYLRNTSSFFQEDHLTATNMFLFAICDDDFLFDSSLCRRQPGIFISREAIRALKNNSNQVVHHTFSDTVVYPLKESSPEDTQRAVLMMEQQVRELQLMQAGRHRFAEYYINNLIPTVKRQQKRISQALTTPKRIHHKGQDELSNIGRICMDCFLWYLESMQHLNLSGEKRKELGKDIERVNRFLSEDKYVDFMQKLLSRTQKDDWIKVWPLLVYRVMTKRRSDVTHLTPSALKKTILLDSDHPTTGCMSPAKTARMTYRCNVLLFQKLCLSLKDYLSEDDTERVRFYFEFTEPFSEERYAGEDILSLEPGSDAVRAYISEGKNAGEYIYCDLIPILERVRKNMDISPYDLFPHDYWKLNQSRAYQDLYSLEKDNALGQSNSSSRGRSISLWSFVHKGIDTYKNGKPGEYEKLLKKYGHEVFDNINGYGSGLQTYEQAFSVAEITDYLLDNCPKLKIKCSELGEYDELVEIAIHKVLLEECLDRALKNAQDFVKTTFYSRELLSVSQENEDVDTGLSIDDNDLFIQGDISPHC